MGWWESNVAANQMLYYFCFLFNNNTPPSWMALATLFLLFSSYLLLLGFGFFSILYTSLLLILSTTVVILYSTVSKHKAVYVDNLVPEEKDLISFEDQESSSDQKENYAAPTLLQKHGSTEEKEGQEVHKPDLLSSESECQDQYQLWTSDESEVGWSFQYDVDDNSDGSISDEESLIEIALPSGQCSLQHKKRELSAEALLSQQTIIREFLAEFNEEENLIEIDISMGSIKYSRFEIKA